MRWTPYTAIFGGVGLLLSAEPALSQSLGSAPDDGVSLWRVAGALLFCLALGVAGAFLLKTRYGRGYPLTFTAQRRRRLALVEAVRLSPTSSLAIVCCDDVEMLILTSADTASVVGQLPLKSGDRPELHLT